MATRQVAVPDEWLSYFGTPEEARDHLAQAAVLDLVRRHVVSQGRGAELLGLSLWDFRDLMADHDLPTVELEEHELDEGHRNLREALGST